MKNKEDDDNWPIRELRSGSWYDPVPICRVTVFTKDLIDTCSDGLGFRPARRISGAYKERGA
jgi:hypothetical protein